MIIESFGLGSTAASVELLAPGAAEDDLAALARTMGIRALARNVSGTVSDVATSGLPVVLTKHGRPVAAIVPIETFTGR